MSAVLLDAPERVPRSYEVYRAVRVFSALDGLRCLAVLAVVWHHSVRDPAIWRLFPATRFGFLGVDLFFEISGFLIVTLLLRERERRGIGLGRFYARRALRILPLYYGFLAAFAVLYFVVRPNGSGAAAFRSELPVMLLHLANWIPVSGMFAITWSLSAEEQFYLVWPPLEKWLPRATRWLVVIVIVASQLVQFGLIDGVLSRWFGWSRDEPSFLRETTFTPICLGVWLAHLLHDPRRQARVQAWLGHPFAAPAALLALIVICNLLPEDIRGAGRLVAHLAMLVLLAACVVREDNGLRRFLTWRALARIGTISYGVYLLHHVALGVASAALGRLGVAADSLAFFVLGGGLSVGLAELSFRFYESRFLRLRERFR